MMTPAARKTVFRKLATGRNLGDVARLLGVPVDTARAWHKPSNPRSPDGEQIRRLRKAVLQELTEQIRGLGHEVIPRQRTAA